MKMEVVLPRECSMMVAAALARAVEQINPIECASHSKAIHFLGQLQALTERMNCGRVLNARIRVMYDDDREEEVGWDGK